MIEFLLIVAGITFYGFMIVFAANFWGTTLHRRWCSWSEITWNLCSSGECTVAGVLLGIVWPASIFIIVLVKFLMFVGSWVGRLGTKVATLGEKAAG